MSIHRILAALFGTTSSPPEPTFLPPENLVASTVFLPPVLRAPT